MVITSNKTVFRLRRDVKAVNNGAPTVTPSAYIETVKPAVLKDIPKSSVINGKSPTLINSVDPIPNALIASASNVNFAFGFFDETEEAVPREFSVSEEALTEEQDDNHQQNREYQHTHTGNGWEGKAADCEAFVQKAEELFGKGNNEGCHYRAGDAAHTADDYDEEQLIDQCVLEVDRSNDTDDAGNQATAQAGHKAGDNEGPQLVCKKIDAHCLGGHFIVTDRLERAAIACPHHAQQQENHNCEETDAPSDVCCGGNVFQTQRTVC